MKLPTKIALIIFSGATIGAVAASFLVFSFTRSSLEQTIGNQNITVIASPARDTALNLVFLLIPIFFLTTSVVILFVVVFVVRPITRLTKTAKAIAEGNITERAPEISTDEVGELAKSFNAMAERLVNLNEETKAILQTLPEPLFVLTEDGVVTSVNRAASEMVGHSEKEMRGRLLRDVLAGIALLEEAKDVALKIEEGVAAAKPIKFEEVSIKNKVFEVFITPVKDYQGRTSHGAVIFHDITHIKEIDRLKTEFVSVASHQLRTPLTVINWYIEMLLSGDAGKIEGAKKDYLQEIYGASKRMVRLINDLLNVSRLDSGRLKIESTQTQLEDFIENVLAELRPVAKEKSCDLLFKKPKVKLPKVGIDQSLLRQVIQNLVTNSIRYSEPKLCDTAVTLEKRDDKEYLVTIKDNGIGIPKEIQARIFDKFFRADNAIRAVAEGTGLGLYIAKMIIETSGGKIWFSSEPGAGTTFYFTIPLTGMKKKGGELGLAQSP